jgi:hypothetical protein
VAFDSILGIQKHSKVYEYKTDFTMDLFNMVVFLFNFRLSATWIEHGRLELINSKCSDLFIYLFFERRDQT